MKKDLTGERFWRLLVLERAGSTLQQKALWLCRCDCGNEVRVTTGSLHRGTKSCGCIRAKVNVEKGRLKRVIDYESVKCHVCGIGLKDRFLNADRKVLRGLTFKQLDKLACRKCHGAISRKNWDSKNVAGRSIVVGDPREQVVIGSVLGDGSLEFIPGSLNYGLTIKHGLKQEKYLLWKALLLDNLVSKVDYPRGRVRLRTIKHPFMTALASDFIIDGRKSVSKKWVERMGPLAFAIWYLDDGNLLPNRVGKNGRLNKPSIRFSTNSFTESEDNILMEELRRKVGVSPGRCQWLHRRAFGVELSEPRKYFGIRLHGDDVETFLSYIRPSVDWIRCGMSYKADTTLRGPLDNRHTRRRSEVLSSVT